MKGAAKPLFSMVDAYLFIYEKTESNICLRQRCCCGILKEQKLLVDNNHSGKYNIDKNHLINWCF